ncbi:MAG: hypothetical protein WCK49_03190, partial [Myxococcaceae bacterium]
FEISKVFYVLLLGYCTWTLSHLISKPSAINLAPLDLELATSLIAPGAVLVFGIILLFTRRHAS